MDFDSPEVMKDFPGLYSSERRKGNDSDYNEENEKATKKEMIIGKRKEKKDKKEKDKGYAALEGESSDEASPYKTKKSKTFKFTKTKDKDKEKEHCKEKADCRTKKKTKLQKFPRAFGTGKVSLEETGQDLAEAMPIFGASLSSACVIAKCHDDIPVPLPIRECIDYLEVYGINFENIYKISGPKNKVQQIKKMYNNRQAVKFTDYDVPTVTSVLKTFLRELPAPIFTTNLIVRFEEAGAILNYNTRKKHLQSLINLLSKEHQTTLAWLIIHFYNISLKEQVNKMSKQHISQALNHCLHISSRLLYVLICHRNDLFPKMQIIKYHPPLEAGTAYPEDPETIELELRKLESALNLIHWEMQQGFISETRQDQLWDVQRVQTELKRKLKKTQNQVQQASNNAEEAERAVRSLQVDEDESEACASGQNGEGAEFITEHEEKSSPEEEVQARFDFPTVWDSTGTTIAFPIEIETVCPDTSLCPKFSNDGFNALFEEKLEAEQIKNKILHQLLEQLRRHINDERREVERCKGQLEVANSFRTKNRRRKLPRNIDKVRELLIRENHMLEIKKVQLVRQIVENREQCLETETRIRLLLEKRKTSA